MRTMSYKKVRGYNVSIEVGLTKVGTNIWPVFVPMSHKNP